MNGFPGINKDNGLIAPSRCDLEALKSVYVQERQVAAAGSYGRKRAEREQTEFPLTAAPVRLASAPSSPVLDPPRPPADSSLLWWDMFFKF
jgi:hypothetical protein